MSLDIGLDICSAFYHYQQWVAGGPPDTDTYVSRGGTNTYVSRGGTNTYVPRA